MEHVYRLIDPRDSLPFYVGITNNPNIRYVQHCAPDEESAKSARIASIRGDGLEPIFEVIESYRDRQIALEQETYWIHTYESQGMVLTNIAHIQRVVDTSSTLIEQRRSGSIIAELAKKYSEEALYSQWEDFYQAADKSIPLSKLAKQFLRTIATGAYWSSLDIAHVGDELAQELFILSICATYSNYNQL
jgi:hypothetical protein